MTDYFDAVASISTRKARPASAATCKVERATVFGFSVRVADAPGVKIAYAEVRPAIATNRRGFTGWAVLTAKETAWEVMWAVRRDGSMQTCSEVRGAYNYARRIAALADADRTLFSSSFDQDAEKTASGSSDDLCEGAIIIDDQGGE